LFEWYEMQVWYRRVIQHRAIDFYPGVSFEPPILLAGANAQAGPDSTPLEQPAEHEGSLETIRANEEVACGGLLESRNGVCGTQDSRIRCAHAPNPLAREPTEHPFPATEANHAQAHPCGHEPNSSL
jgi:hypothetical protein